MENLRIRENIDLNLLLIALTRVKKYKNNLFQKIPIKYFKFKHNILSTGEVFRGDFCKINVHAHDNWWN